MTLAGVLTTSHRKTNKRLQPVGQAVELLRANELIKAERVDAETGEIRPLSDSAVTRALRTYRMHPDQLNRPAPAVELRSLHPNHVWQIDASLCVLYYLHDRGRESGLQVMDKQVFYKNKPANLARVAAERVWSYEVTDHYSGAVFVHYVMGAESGANLAESFINATQQKDGNPFHGVPFILMMDQGSANTSGMFTNLARRLGVEMIVHAPGNARATGQVEKARDIIERSFESGLKLQPVRNLEELNAKAAQWSRWYNAARIHRRHGKSRVDMWLTIKPEQLRIAPPVELMQALITHNPEMRKVEDRMRINFGGKQYDVSKVPGVMQGEKLAVTYNPYAHTSTALVVTKDAAGAELLVSVPLVEKDAAGFALTGNVIGQDFKRPADTALDTHRKEVLRTAYAASTDKEVEEKVRKRVAPFGGGIDPMKVIERAPKPSYLPKVGTDLAVTTTTPVTPVPARVLTLFEVASWLASNGVAMTPEKLAQVRGWYAAGVPEDELDAVKQRLTVRSGLRVVNGGAV